MNLRMKILHINYNDSYGGAAIAARRHCEAMKRAGFDAKLLTLRKLSKCDFVVPIYKCKLIEAVYSRVISKLESLFICMLKPWGTFSYPLLSTSIKNHPLVREADIIYIHWVAASMLSTKEIEAILKMGKIVRWYMHDMNPITGGCHHALSCEQYKSRCVKCPLLKRGAFFANIASRQFDKRLNLWSRHFNLEAYTPSRWLGDCVKQSALWKKHKVKVFPNVVDTDVYSPKNKQSSRSFFKINTNKRIILFGAAGINDAYKGWAFLRDALNMLNPNNYMAVIIGRKSESIERELRIECLFLGYIKDEQTMITAYNAADVLVSASLAENFPNVIIEAMSCGVPCVGFDVGGIPDQINHKVNGYLANYRDSKSLADGIQFICEANQQDYNQMSSEARNYVLENASYRLYERSNPLNS